MYNHGAEVDLGFTKTSLKGEYVANILSASANVPLSSWTHMAFAFGNAKYVIYMNGNEVGTGPIPGSLSLASGTVTLLGTSTNRLIGYATEFRIWETQRLYDEIKRNYRRHLYCPGCSESSLVLVWGFNEGEGNTLYGYSQSSGATSTVQITTTGEWHSEIKPVPICEGDIRTPYYIVDHAIATPPTPIELGPFALSIPFTIIYWAKSNPASTSPYIELFGLYSSAINFAPCTWDSTVWHYHYIECESSACEYHIERISACDSLSAPYLNPIVLKIKIYQTEAFIRGLKVFDTSAVNLDIEKEARHKFLSPTKLHYDFTDNQGASLLKDFDSINVVSFAPNLKAFVWIPLESVPIICIPPSIYGSDGLCADVFPLPSTGVTHSIPTGLDNPNDGNILTFWMLLKSDCSDETNILEINYSSVNIWKTCIQSKKLMSVYTGSTYAIESKEIQTNEWYHVIIEKYTGSSGIELGLYLNGIKDTTTISPSPSPTMIASGPVIYGTTTSTDCSSSLYIYQLKGYKPVSFPFSVMPPTISATMILHHINKDLSIKIYSDSSSLSSYPASGAGIPKPSSIKAESQGICVHGYYFDTVGCVPITGYLIVSDTPNRKAQFQMIPIGGRLQNFDSWTLEGWVVANLTTASSDEYAIFGLGSDGYAFVVTHESNHFYLREKIDGAYISNSLSIPYNNGDFKWDYIVLRMLEYGVPNNYQLSIEGATPRIVEKDSAWLSTYSSNVYNYTFIGGILNDNTIKQHISLRVKNIRLWKGGISDDDLLQFRKRNINSLMDIPELLEYYDFSQPFETVLYSYNYPGVSPFRIRSHISGGDYYPPAYFYSEPSIDTLFNPGVISLLKDISTCPPDHTYRDNECFKDEATTGPFSPELKNQKITLQLKDTLDYNSPDWTIEFWLKVRELKGIGIVIMKQTSSGLEITKNGGMNSLVVIYDGPGITPNVRIPIDSNCGFAFNAWLHIALVNNEYDNTFKVFLHKSTSANECPSNPASYASAIGRLNLNGGIELGSGGPNFDGKIKEFRLWNMARSKDFDISLYRHIILDKNSFSHLIIYYPLNKGSDSSIKDKIRGYPASLTTPSPQPPIHWSQDHDLPMCNFDQVFDETYMTCESTLLRKSSETIFDIKKLPRNDLTFSLWIKNLDISTNSAYIILGDAAFKFSLESTKYQCEIKLKSIATSSNPSILVQHDEVIPQNEWLYVGCAWESQRNNLIINIDNIIKLEPGNLNNLHYIDWTDNKVKFYTSNALIKHFRLYEYYQTVQQILAEKYIKPDIYNPQLVLYAMLDNFASDAHDPANKLMGTSTAPCTLVNNDKAFDLTSEDKILLFAKDTSGEQSVLTIPIPKKSFDLMDRYGFTIRFQVKFDTIMTGTIKFFSITTNKMEITSDSSWTVKLNAYDYYKDVDVSCITTLPLVNKVWNWVYAIYDPNSNKIMIGTNNNQGDPVFGDTAFENGLYVQDISDFNVIIKDKAKFAIREYSIQTTVLTPNDLLLLNNRRIDLARDASFLLINYRFNEGMGNFLYDTSMGYYKNLLWNADPIASRINIGATLGTAVKWEADQSSVWGLMSDNFYFCRPSQIMNKEGLCVDTNKVLWITKAVTQEIKLPQVNLDSSYTVEFWLYAKYVTSLYKERLISLTNFRIYFVIGNSIDVKCEVGGQTLIYTGIAATQIRSTWSHISYGVKGSKAVLRFNGDTMDSSIRTNINQGDCQSCIPIIAYDDSVSTYRGFQGSMRELRIWKSFIPSGTLKMLMRKELKPSAYCGSLAAYWKLHESSGNILYDSCSAENKIPNPGLDWIELPGDANKLKLVGPSEHLDYATGIDYYRSLDVDKVMNILFTSSFDKTLPFLYGNYVPDFTVCFWIKLISIGGSFSIYLDEHFKVDFKPNSVPELTVTYSAGRGNTQQLDAAKIITSGRWARVQLSLKSIENKAFAYYITDSFAESHTVTATNAAFSSQTATDSRIHLKGNNCNIYLKSMDIWKEYYDSTNPPNYDMDLMPKISDDLIFYVRFGEVYGNKMYDHSLYGDEFTVSFDDTTLVYDEISVVCRPKWTSVVSEDDASGKTTITFTFEEEITAPIGSLPDNEISCDKLFIVKNVEEMGSPGTTTSPKCKIDGKQIIVTAGYASEYTPSTKFMIKRDTIYTKNCIFPLIGRKVPLRLNDEKYYELKTPTIDTVPTIELSAPVNYLMCSSSSLDIVIKYSGLVKRDSVSFSMTCNPPTCVITPPAALNGGTNIATVSLPTNDLQQNTIYKFTATVKNFRNKDARSTVDVVTSSLNSFAIEVDGASNVWKRHMNLTLKIRLKTTACDYTFIEEGCSQFTFSLRQLNPLASQIPPSRIMQKNCWTFIILANSLDWNKDYWVLAEGRSISNPSIVIIKKILLRAELEKPIAYIKGSIQTLTYMQTFNMEGGSVDERDPSEVLSYEWNCYSGTGFATICKDSLGADTNIPSGNPITLKTDYFADLNFDICLRIKSTWGSAEVTSDLVCKKIIVEFTEKLLHPQIIPSSPFINVEEDYFLACYASQDYGEVEYEWPSQTPSYLYTSLDGTVPPSESQFIKIAAGTLNSALSYTFECKVKLKNVPTVNPETTILKPLIVLLYPSSTPLQANPNTIQELTDICTIEAVDWADANCPGSHCPPKYSFYYKIGSNDRQLIQANRLSNRAIVYLPAGDPSNGNKLDIIVIITDSRGVSSVSAPIQVIVTPIGNSDTKLQRIRTILSKTSMDDRNNFAYDVDTVLNYITSITDDLVKVELYEKLLSKLEGFDMTKEDADYLVLPIIKIIKDALAMPKINDKYYISSLDLLTVLIKTDIKLLESLYPDTDYLNNAMINYGLPSTHIKSIADIVNTIISKFSDRDFYERVGYSYETSDKISSLISDIGLLMLKDKFPGTTVHEITESEFKIMALRTKLETTKSLQLVNGLVKMIFPPEGLWYSKMVDSYYDILFIVILPVLHPFNGQSLMSNLVRISIYDGSKDRTLSSTGLNSLKILNCVPITLEFSEVSLTAERSTAVCGYYNPSAKKYISKEVGVVTTKYNRVTKEAACTLSHLSDFAVIENPEIITKTNYYILSLVIIFGLILHIWSCLTSKCIYKDYVLGYSESINLTNAELKQSHGTHSDPNNPPQDDESANRAGGNSNTSSTRYWYPSCTLLWYCYLISHSIWKVFVLDSILYTRHAFAHLCMVRYTLMMALLNLLFRYDVFNSKTITARIGYAILILPILSFVTRFLKFLFKNTPINRAQPYSKTCFTWRLVIGYNLGVCIILGSGIIIALNERITPYRISIELTELYLITMLIDIIVYQLLAGLFQFIVVLAVYKGKAESDLDILVDDELKEELGLIEPSVLA